MSGEDIGALYRLIGQEKELEVEGDSTINSRMKSNTSKGSDQTSASPFLSIVYS